MNKIFICVTIGAMMLMSGCSNAEQKQINAKGDFFSKKKECSAMISDIEQRTSFKNYTDEKTSVWIDRIFYSPKIDSCIYLMIASTTLNDNGYVRAYILKDGLTEKELFSTDACVPATIENCNSLTDADIKTKEEIAKYE